jgi:tetratricopeptide (TPR) repeat protein
MVTVSFSGRLAAILLPLLLLLAGCRSAHSYFERGDAAFDRGKFEEASINYRNATQKDPSLGEAYYKSALAELKLRKAAEALQDLQQAVQLMPENEAAKTELTDLLLGSFLGNPKRPKFLYDLLVKFSGEWLGRDPNSIQGLRIRGYLAMLERRPEEAVERFRRAYELNRRDQKIALSLMNALARDNQTEAAAKVGLEFIATDPTAADAYDALYRLYMSANRAPDAGNVLVRKVNANPQQGEYILQLASFYSLAHNKPEADKTMQRYLANAGGDPKVHLKAGDFYVATADWVAALQQYNAGMAGQPQNKMEYQDRIARVLLMQDKRPEALNILNEVLAKKPDDKDALALRAGLMLDGGGSDKSREALQQFQALVDKNPENIFLRFTLSKALLETGNLAGARTQLEQIVQRSPSFLDAQISLADVAFRLGGFAEAVEHAEDAVEIDPRNTRAEMLLGNSLQRSGDLERAANVFRDLSIQLPDSVDLRLQLGQIDIQKKSLSDAETVFEKILKSNPGEVRALAGLVDIDFAQKHPERALAMLHQELVRSHASPQVLYLAAVTAVRSGRFDEAIDDLQQLAVKTPNSIDPQIELANVLRMRGDYPRAIDTLRKAALLQPKDPRPNSMLSTLLEMTNQHQEATALAKKALDQKPDDAAAMNNLAFLLAKTSDDLEAALKLARTAVNKAPQEPYFEDTLAFIYLKKGQNVEAMQIFNRLTRSFPNEPIFTYHLGMTYFQMGNRVKAKATLTRALQQRPPKDVETGVSDLISRIN